MTFRETYWGLGENWWKPIYDGKFHSFGPQVFDQGLHGTEGEDDLGGTAEPGYYESIKQAYEYGADQLGQPLTIDCYKKIHALACKHFSSLSPNIINVDQENMDKFRNRDCKASRNLTKSTYKPKDLDQNKRRRLKFLALNSIRHSLQSDDIDTKTGSQKELSSIPIDKQEAIIKQYKKTPYHTKYKIDPQKFFTKGISAYESAIQSAQDVENEMKAVQELLNLPQPFATLKINASGAEIFINISYNYTDPNEIEGIVKKLIDHYNQQINLLPTQLQQRSELENSCALQAVASLFQYLEWLHPFFDGQGRTDLVLLAKLLTENGFNPAILYEPYFSTFEPLNKWTYYLKEGIKSWKKEVNDQSA